MVNSASRRSLQSPRCAPAGARLPTAPAPPVSGESGGLGSFGYILVHFSKQLLKPPACSKKSRFGPPPALPEAQQECFNAGNAFAAAPPALRAGELGLPAPGRAQAILT